jgi:predicted ATPase
MYRRLSIEGFRRFSSFELRQLGRVNLLVGQNNCGKTTVLEALQILTARSRPLVVYNTLMRRGEKLPIVYESDQHSPRRPVEVDTCRLFHGYQLGPGISFNIRGFNDVHTTMIASVEEMSDDELAPGAQRRLFSESEEQNGRNVLVLNWDYFDESIRLPLTGRGGLSTDFFRRLGPQDQIGPREPVRYIESASLSISQVVRLLDEVALTAAEETVLDALRIIEPSIQRIASVATTEVRPSSRSGIVVRCENVQERVPIGSLGDGIWRMLGLILSLVRAEGGILLVDEIDTGFHYSVMSDMWRLIYMTAAKLDVQVFATTHSSDCCSSLAAFISSSEGEAADVSIQRVDPATTQSVAFSSEEIVVAAERGIEIR